MTVTTTSFETTSLEEAGDLMASAYAEGRLRISASNLDGFRLAQTRHDCGPVYLDTYSSNLPLDFHTHLDDVVMLTRMTAGGLHVDDQHQPFSAGRGDLFAVTARRPYRAVTTGTTMITVGVHLSLLVDLAPEDSAFTIQSLEHQLVDPSRARAWNHTVSAVTAHLTELTRHVNAQPHSQLLVDSTNRILAAVMLSTLHPIDDVPSDRTDAHSPTVRRAVSFIESNPDTPITVVDIARATAVTPKALQHAFRRHLHTTPTDYLRQVRLERAREDLREPVSRDGTTVATVAARWGFANLARFSRDYQRSYGEPPSTTIEH